MKDLKLLVSMLLAVAVLLNMTNCQSRQDTQEAVKNSQVSFKKEEGVRFKQELESWKTALCCLDGPVVHGFAMP